MDLTAKTQQEIHQHLQHEVVFKFVGFNIKGQVKGVKEMLELVLEHDGKEV